jgi:hypothetical protein
LDVVETIFPWEPPHSNVFSTRSLLLSGSRESPHQAKTKVRQAACTESEEGFIAKDAAEERAGLGLASTKAKRDFSLRSK